MRKKTIAIILIFVFALGMAACSDGGAASVINDTASDDSGSEEEFTEIEGRTVQGPETVDVGEFVVDVPKGWLGVHELDWDTLEDDGPVGFATNQYGMVKGGQTSQDITIDSPNIDIWYTAEDSVETLLETIDYMDEIIELDLELEGKECKAVHTVLNLEDQGPDESDMVFFPLSDSSCIRVIINTNGGGVDTGLSIEDSDVLAILNSIQVK